MSLTATKSSCVILGTFNIYIFQPNWIGEILKIPEGEQLEWQTDFRRPGFKINYPKNNVEIVVRPDRVGLTCSGDFKQLADASIRILERLPETPLEAIGLNFELNLKLKEFKAEIQPLIYKRDDADSVCIHHALAAKYVFESKTVNLSSSTGDPSDTVDVSTNVHFQVKSKLIDEKIKFIQSYDKEFNMVNELVSKLWLEGVQNDS